MSFPIAVLVSGTGSNLQAILDTVHGTDGIEVVAVGSNNPHALGLKRAQEAGVETGVFQTGGYGSREERDAALGDWLERHDVELVVLAGFMELLSPEFIRRFAGRIINVHPSLLPAFRGLRAIEQALEYGVRVMGVTVHFVDEGVDSGPVLLQKSFDLPLSYSPALEEVENKVHAIEHELLPQAIRLIARGAVRPDPGNPRRTTIEEQVDVGH